MASAHSLAAVVNETAPLRAVAAMMEAGAYEAVVVRTDAGDVLGVLLRDAVLRLSPRLPEAPVRMLPLQKAGSVGPALSREAAENLIEEGTLDAVVLGQHSEQSWSVLLRA